MLDYCKELNDAMYYQHEKFFIQLDGRLVLIDSFEPQNEFTIQISTAEWWVELPVTAPWSVSSSEIQYFDEEEGLTDVFKRAS